jgi:integrase
MTSLPASLDEYLRIRRRLGFEMPQDGRLLEGFVEFLERAGAERVTTELALAWARMPFDAHPHRWRQRLGVARGFARHLATIDPSSEVPPTDLLPGHRPRIAPYIYSEAEIAALMAAARELRPRLRAARHETLIGLLAVTGMFSGGSALRWRFVPRVCAAQRLMIRGYRVQQVWCKWAGGGSPVVVAEVDAGHQFPVGRAGGGEVLVAFGQL